MKIHAIILFLFMALIASCGKRQTLDIEDRATEQYAYFPLKIGKYVDYQVDSIKYDFADSGGIRIDSNSTFVREQVIDSLLDQSGQVLFLIERSERSDSVQNWVVTRINSSQRTQSQAIRIENNLRFLSLIFPMDKRSAWDGNIWIDKSREIEIFGERMRPFANWAYEVDSIDVPANVGSFQFDSTLLVTEVDDNNVIERRLSRVRYAKNIGLVWREQWILDSQYCNQSPPPTDCETKPWEQKAERGYILRQRIISHN
jgi:hypothetical protein